MKKKFYSILITSFCFTSTYAVIIPVSVADFSFTPANFTAAVGDVVRFTWVSGFHTTTATVSDVPPGAAPWDRMINSGSPTFDYTITQPGTYDYICSFHPGMTGSFTASVAAPVKLVDFFSVNSGSTIELKWKTVTEENADYFAVQRSNDGIKFENIGKVTAAGNSNSELKYSFLDETFSKYNRFLYYRLLTIDKDFKQQYSKIILHRVEKVLGKNSFITRIFPNPVNSNGHLHINFNSEKQERLLITIRDVSGQLISTHELFGAEGVNNSHLPLPRLNRGNYLLIFSLNGRREAYPLSIK